MHLGLHHAVKKKKQGNDDWLDRIMIVVGLAAPLSLIPQVMEIWVNQSAAGISVISWALLAGVSFSWMIYGIIRHSTALFISNVFMTILNIAVVIGALYFQ